MHRTYDILIVGGGIIGSSIAYSLSKRTQGVIGVVDVDLTGYWGSTERNAGGVRATWEQPTNIDLSRRSIAFYETVANEVGFRQSGYLWLHDDTAWDLAQPRLSLQQGKGLQVEILTVGEIKNRYPFLDRLGGVVAATFSPHDGLINPNLLKLYYRNAATAKGVLFHNQMAIESLTVEGRQCRKVRLCEMREGTEAFLKTGEIPKRGSFLEINVKILVNAGGAWAPRLAKLYGKETSVIPIRRQVAVVHSQDVDLTPYGMFVDTSGLYFHPEGGNILSGYSPSLEQPGYRFDHDGYEFFLQEIWPRLCARSSHFEKLKQVGGWAGLYEVSPDMSAIIGKVEGLDNVYEAHAFSGRGVMQSYAAGEALAELILHGKYQTIDLTSLSGGRFTKGQLVPEGMHI